jgi:hypothetical protein
LSVFKRKAGGRAGRVAKLSAAVALGMGVLSGIGGAFVVGSGIASAATSSVSVPYTCTNATAGTFTIPATVTETPTLPATDQWSTTYSETPSVTLNIPPGLVQLAASFSQTVLPVNGVTEDFGSSGFTQDPGQNVVSPDTQTITVDPTTEASGATATFSMPATSWTTDATAQTDTISTGNLQFGVLGVVTIDCTASPSVLDTVVAHAPIPEPPVVVTPLSPTVSNGQCVAIPVLAGATAQNNTIDPTTLHVTGGPTVGVATVGPNTDPGGNAVPAGEISYCAVTADNPSSLTSDSFTWTVAGTLPTPPATTPAPSNTGTVNITINFLTCQATSAPCSLNQLLLLPLQPGPITLEQPSSLPVDSFGTCSQTPAEAQITGQAQVVCSAITPLTVLNQTGLDTGWTLTGQTTDFVDPADASTALNNCDVAPSAGPPPVAGTYNNHCIPGGNLGWNPVSAVAHDIVPGDTAQVTSGPNLAVPTPIAAAVSANPLFEGAKVQANPVVEPAANMGSNSLRAHPQTLCSTASGQAGGTFVCGGELQLAVPASVANPQAPGYEATLTLTLTL